MTSSVDVRAKLDRVPRVDLARIPTALEPVPRAALPGLSTDEASRVWIKRDDETGFVTSGNKIRKLEFSFGRALAEGATRVITCGGIGSNHCRATAYAAARLGLRATLVLRTSDGARPKDLDGNTLLAAIAGADLEFITPEDYARRDAILEEIARASTERGDRTSVIPEGASDATGSLGFVAAAAELTEQAHAAGLDVARVIHAVGSGGTTAGLSAGVAALGENWEAIGIPVCDDAAYFDDRVEGLRSDLHAAHGLPEPEGSSRRFSFVDGYVGDGYDRSTAGELDDYRRLAATSGLLVDPCYSGKAWRAVERVHQESEDSRVTVFWHTGGAFANYAHRRGWNERLPSRD